MRPVLGIETSCDETGVALFDAGAGLLAHRLHSQVALHADYGGVVPELASRDHVRRLTPLIRAVMADADLAFTDLAGVAYTAGPGLIGALLVGAATACGLATSLDVPAVPVHHMEGHLLAPLLEAESPEFPFVALLVSGGHTLLVEVAGIGRYRILGDTLDDAVGEAFDKSAKLLGLDYPGGPALARLAEEGDVEAFRLPRPMTDRPGLDFSFSGLKTAVRHALASSGDDPRTRADLARGFEEAVVDTLVIKCRRALKQTAVPRLVVAGGVGANRRLRAALASLMSKIGGKVYFPRAEFCTDNGAMIAHVGSLRLADGHRAPLEISARPRWSLEELSPPGA